MSKAQRRRSMFERIKNYLTGVRGEMARVTWPTRKEVISLTALILLLVVVVTLYVFVIDQGVLAVITNLTRLRG